MAEYIPTPGDLPGEQWKPSHWTAGESFHAQWCCNCAKDAVMNGSATQEQADRDPDLYCPIIGVSYWGDAVEWRKLEDGRRICTAFVPKGQPVPTQRCASTGDMFADSAAGVEHG
jgi:hypothetical protein